MQKNISFPLTRSIAIRRSIQTRQIHGVIILHIIIIIIHIFTIAVSFICTLIQWEKCPTSFNYTKQKSNIAYLSSRNRHFIIIILISA